MIGRLIGTALAVLAYGVVMMAYTPAATLITGKVAGRQFENSDAAYYTAISTINFFNLVNVLLSLALLVVLILIWLKPVRTAIKQAIEESGTLVAIIAVGGTLLLGATNANAYFEKDNRTEAYPILPNQTAFWIPEVGATRDNQAQTEDEAYYNTKKVQFNRFVIPHQKLTGSAGTSFFSGWDYFVPTGRLIIVDRTPYSREWVDAHDRGTSNRKEGFPCQSKEGLNIAVGVSIGTSVLPENAAKYLYRFGVIPPAGQVKGDAASIENDGRIIFTSVYYSRSVKDVMDDVGRKKIQTLVCDEIADKTFDAANTAMKTIMDKVKTEATTYFASVGITLDFLGYADTWGFDDEVQKAINRRYAARQDEMIAQTLQPYTEVIKALAQAQAVRTFGDKTDGKLPSTFVGMPPDIIGQILGVQGAATATRVAPVAPAK